MIFGIWMIMSDLFVGEDCSRRNGRRNVTRPIPILAGWCGDASTRRSYSGRFFWWSYIPSLQYSDPHIFWGRSWEGWRRQIKPKQFGSHKFSAWRCFCVTIYNFIIFFFDWRTIVAAISPKKRFNFFSPDFEDFVIFSCYQSDQDIWIEGQIR